MQVFSHGVEVNSPGFLPKDLGERDVEHGSVCGNPFGEYHGQHVGIAQLRNLPIDTAPADSLHADQSHHGCLLRYHLAADNPTPPGPLYALLSPWGIGVELWAQLRVPGVHDGTGASARFQHQSDIAVL